MTYITTYHPFIIDDKHPADVFAEMANFFSLYTVAIDSLNRMSIQLGVPAEFDIEVNEKHYDSYQQFIKAVRYSIPEVNILPIKPLETASQNHSIVLMIQYFEGRMANDITAENTTKNGEPKPKFYQKILGGLLPKFAREVTQDGLYPEQIAPVMAIPESAQQPIPVPQPIPQFVPFQPTPVPQPIPQPIPIAPRVQSTVTAPPASIPTPISNPVANPASIPNLTPTSINPQSIKPFLPKPSKSIKPYRDILTQAILSEIQKQATIAQPITTITFKTKDSLTTAFIETVFASFSPVQNGLGQAGDTIDLASYGLEELRPKLTKIGVNLSDEAQFLLKSNAKTCSEDIALIQQGQLDASAINLGVQLDYAQVKTSAQPQPNPMPQGVQINSSTLNANRFNIALNIKVSDSMGERTVKLREFPAVFSTQNTPSQPAKLIKLMASQVSGELFYLNEQDGQLLASKVAQNITLQRSGQALSLQENMTLLPHDVLQISNEVKISLLLN